MSSPVEDVQDSSRDYLEWVFQFIHAHRSVRGLISYGPKKR